MKLAPTKCLIQISAPNCHHAYRWNRAMSLRQMEYFLTVAKEGSFSRAATELNVTQPGLSQQVIALEAELGAPLFERLGRGVRITAAGRAYLPYAEAAVTARRRGRQAVENVRAGLGGELELATV